MNIPLPDFETSLLNKVVHTQTFADYIDLKTALQQKVEELKDDLISSGKTTDEEFPAFKGRTVTEIQQFLLRNDFFSVRDGGVYFLTEKGKNLQKQGSLEKYGEWQEARNKELLDDLHTIEEKGYLDKDQTFKKEYNPAAVDEQKKLHFGYYVVIIIVLILLAAFGKTHKWW